MPAEDLAVILNANNGANFVELVNSWSGRDDAAQYVLLTQRAFYGEPDLLYIALRYASLIGVPLLFVPEDDNASRSAA